MMHSFRKNLRLIRKSTLAQSRDSIQLALAERLSTFIEEPLPKMKRIGAYFATDEELDIHSILQQYFISSQLYYPILHPILKRSMWFSNHSKHTRNRFGIVEPQFDHRHIIAPWELDIVFVPLVGFDKRLNRIGMGGGFYDYSFRFKFTTSQPLWIGVALDEQEVENIASQAWDIPLDYLITPTRILKND